MNSARFLVIVLLIGIFGLADVSIHAGTRRDRSKDRWQVLPADRDIMLLRNQPRHIIEGAGAGGMLLGESEVQLRHKYGEPAYRDFAAPETLYYTEERFSAFFKLTNGRIIEIGLEVEKHKVASLEWFTAQGLHESDLKGLSPQKAFELLGRFYGTRRLRQVGDSVDVLSRGIRFRFRGNALIRVEVYKPQDYADAGEY